MLGMNTITLPISSLRQSAAAVSCSIHTTSEADSLCSNTHGGSASTGPRTQHVLVPRELHLNAHHTIYGEIVFFFLAGVDSGTYCLQQTGGPAFISKLGQHTATRSTFLTRLEERKTSLHFSNFQTFLKSNYY